MISLCILTTCLLDHVWIMEGEVTYQLLLGVKDLTCCPNSIDPFCFPPKYYHGYYEWMQIQNLYVFMIFPSNKCWFHFFSPQWTRILKILPSNERSVLGQVAQNDNMGLMQFKSRIQKLLFSVTYLTNQSK